MRLTLAHGGGLITELVFSMKSELTLGWDLKTLLKAQ